MSYRPRLLSLTAAALVSQLGILDVAMAQQAADAPAAPAAEEKKSVVEEITVTGTRIRRKDLNTPAPVTVISREQIAATGKVTVGELLQALPEVGSNTNSQVNNAGEGALKVDLRNLGQARTLVLLNGKRFVAGGIFVADASVDLNSIPTAIIERIEVLKDGASAVYGSDAIAGVVNLITRRNYQGTEVSAFIGGTTRSDGGSYDVSITSGFAGDTGSAVFSAGYNKIDPVWAGNRDFSTYQLALDFPTGEETKSGSSRVPAGRIYGLTSAANGGVAGGNAYYNSLVSGPNASRTAFIFNNGPTAPDYIVNGPNGVGGAVVCNAAGTHCARPFRGGLSGVDLPVSGGDGYNFNKANYLFTPLQRIQLWSSGDTRIGSVARGYYEASYVNRQSDQKLAPEPLIIGADGEQDIYVSRDNMYNPFGRSFNQTPLAAGGADLTLCSDPNNPATCNFGRVSKRLEEFSNRHTAQDVDTFRVLAGVDGTLGDWAGPLRGISWDLFANYGRTQGTSTNTGNLNKTRLQNALGPSMLVNGVPTCVLTPGDATSALSDGCVPLNLFGGPGTITQDQVGYLTYEGNLRGFVDMFMVGAQANTELFKLMSDRPAALALGYENRHERGFSVPDSLSAAGLGTGGASAPTKGGFRSNEAFAEISLPIVSGMSGVEELEATLAGRFVDYDTWGSKFTYKVGARYTPIRDVTVRGTYSTAFRAPSVVELYRGQTDSFESGEDPCALNANLNGCPHPGTATAGTGGQVKSKIGGNPDLKPEKANIFTAGVVVQPTMVKGLSVTVDYYNLKVDDSIISYGAFAIMNGCHAGSGDPLFCSLITRDAQGEILSLDDRTKNGRSDTVQGIDFAVRYSLPTPVGRFGVGFDGAYIIKWDRQVSAGWTVPIKGNYDLAVLGGGSAVGGAQPAFKGIGSLTWAWKGVGAALSGRYVGGFKECAREDGGADGANGGGLCTPPPGSLYVPLSRNIASYVTFDGALSYETSSAFGKSSVAVGMRNIADKQPPIVYSGFTMNSDPGLYDYMGRFVYVRLSQRF